MQIPDNTFIQILLAFKVALRRNKTGDFFLFALELQQQICSDDGMKLNFLLTCWTSYLKYSMYTIVRMCD